MKLYLVTYYNPSYCCNHSDYEVVDSVWDNREQAQKRIDQIKPQHNFACIEQRSINTTRRSPDFEG